MLLRCISYCRYVIIGFLKSYVGVSVAPAVATSRTRSR